MREIKFRAWDKRRSLMIGTDYPNNWYKGNKDEWYANEQLMMLTGIEDISKDEDFTLMQYTGLKDKNGKKIYEGDILKLYLESYNMTYIYVVEWYTKRAFFTFEELWLYTSKTVDKDRNRDPIVWHENYEVIGNIYGNPELMNK